MCAAELHAPCVSVTLETPLGEMRAFASRDGLRALIFEGSDPAANGVCGEVFDGARNEVLRACAAQLRE